MHDPAAMVCARCHEPYGMFLRDPLTGRAVHAGGCPSHQSGGAPLRRLAPHLPRDAPRPPVVG
jgi:hypothetical protein